MAQLNVLSSYVAVGEEPELQIADYVVASDEPEPGDGDGDQPFQIMDHIVPAGRKEVLRGGARRGARSAARARRGAREEVARSAARAVVGGVDYAVGGWGEYEICRRRVQWETARELSGAFGEPINILGGASGAGEIIRARYVGHTHVSAADVVSSILRESRATLGGAGRDAANAESAVSKAARALAQELSRLEDRLCSPDEEGVWECVQATELRKSEMPKPKLLTTTVPALTSTDLLEFAEDPDQETDPEALRTLGDDVVSLAAALGLALPDLPSLEGLLPALPARVIPVSDEEGVLRLESAVAPYVSSVEELQAALATRLDATAGALRAALRAEPAIPDASQPK
jgi:hypothetical protein